MKFLALSIILLLAIPALAQTQPEFTKPEIKVEYDRFKDETTVSAMIPLRPGNIAQNLAMREYVNGQLGAFGGMVIKLDHITLLLLSKTPGPRPIAQSKIAVGIISIFDKQRIAADQELIFLVDGQRIRCGVLSAIESKSAQEVYFDSVAGPVDFSNVLAVSEGKKVEGRIGSAEFEISGDRLTAVQEFVSKAKGQTEVAPSKELPKTCYQGGVKVPCS